ncbi:NusA-like transcription termination signal-binding factor [Nanoarchaeota archaeon]
MKYDTDLIKKITLFEKVTQSNVKEAFYLKDRLTFIVEPGELGKALGRNKENIRKLNSMFKEKLKIVEFTPEMLDFIVNFLKPLQIQDIEESDGIVTIQGGDPAVNGLIIGKRAQNLRALEEVVNKYFEVTEIKVI